MSSSFTFQEIHSQAATLETTQKFMLDLSIKKPENKCVHLFIGCGTSYYLAISASRFFQETTGMAAQAVPASEVFLHPQQTFAQDCHYKLIAISRSGTTSEVLHALKSVKGNKKIATLAVTCHADSEITQLSGESIILNHVQEKSVVMTQSFTNMLYALQLYSARLAQLELHDLLLVPQIVKETLKDTEMMREIAETEQNQRFIFLGTGSSFGLAEEGCLKLKEMTQTECEAYSALEFRHGPISMVDEKTVVLLLSTGDLPRKIEESLLLDVQSFGGRTVLIGNQHERLGADLVITVPCSSNCKAALLCLMPYLQMLAYYRATALGLSPDHPRNLNQVVKISFSS
ncbi:SIS domain-containing protein [Fictibacillus sp. WQ 8-8]|uniref:SIS domain-containing protein n=1 Tax=Fictibacillus sp. WQ 8-8 TaxID=2938788 RepID=UPI00210A74E2|nr:SIS domain-containing protein [Fictibacillus sp. WQ 8-8]MCQ6267940.1 SIS domain-containing protein [Fictibacillus sp. WQ 8-8]